MNFSIFNFRNPNALKFWVPTTVCTTLFLMWALGEYFYRQTPLHRQKQIYFSQLKIPNNQYYLAKFKKTTDNFRLYHNIGDALQPALTADVIILGNSRALYVFDDKVLKPFFSRHQLSYFNLAITGGTSNFFVALNQKYNFNPKLILLCIDDYLRPSEPMNRIVLKSNRFTANKEILEEYFKFHTSRWLMKYFLNFIAGEGFHVVFRNKNTGAWNTVLSDHITEDIRPVRVRPSRPISPSELAYLDVLRPHLKNTKIVLTYLHGSGKKMLDIAPVAKQLGALTIYGNWQKLTTFDNNHLDQESATVFSKRFMKELQLKLKWSPPIQEVS